VKEGTCKHFNGLFNGVCKTGVFYRDVRNEHGRPFVYPCIAGPVGNGAPVCAARALPTADELAAAEARAEAIRRAMNEAIQAGRCPTCGAAMQMRRVGQCVFAWPCGHQVGQAIPGQTKVGGGL
jgi:hypothetical protein